MTECEIAKMLNTGPGSLQQLLSLQKSATNSENSNQIKGFVISPQASTMRANHSPHYLFGQQLAQLMQPTSSNGTNEGGNKPLLASAIAQFNGNNFPHLDADKIDFNEQMAFNLRFHQESCQTLTAQAQALIHPQNSEDLYLSDENTEGATDKFGTNGIMFTSAQYGQQFNSLVAAGSDDKSATIHAATVLAEKSAVPKSGDNELVQQSLGDNSLLGSSSSLDNSLSEKIDDSAIEALTLSHRTKNPSLKGSGQLLDNVAGERSLGKIQNDKLQIDKAIQANQLLQNQSLNAKNAQSITDDTTVLSATRNVEKNIAAMLVEGKNPQDRVNNYLHRGMGNVLQASGEQKFTEKNLLNKTDLLGRALNNQSGVDGDTGKEGIAKFNAGYTARLMTMSEGKKLFMEKSDFFIQQVAQQSSLLSGQASQAPANILAVASALTPSATSRSQERATEAGVLLSPVGATLATDSQTPAPMRLSPESSFTHPLFARQDFSPNLALRVQWMLNQGLSSAEIMMDPPEMGPLSVKIQQTNGETHIVFQVNNPATKELLEENMQKLKNMLAESGINLGDTEVNQQQRDLFAQSNDTDNTDSQSGSLNSQGESTDEDLSQQRSSVVITSDQLLDVYS
ncbi:flagellar hook-length control protein FliK [Aliikangiella maris]|uniref:Flagellar hook-length control protein FliK n=2 Tax=Aliikangiella maris TaxID=3162458 RepID=A0ABV2BSY4_9GAMM